MKTVLKLATLLFIISLAIVGAYASTITVTGLPSKQGYDYVQSTHTYLDYCPLCCEYDVLIFHKGEYKGTYVPEGELSCTVCGADYDVVSGKDKAHVVRATLTRANVFKFPFPIVWNNYSGVEA